MDLNAWDEAVQQRRVQFERVLNLSALQRKDPQLATSFKIDESIGLQTFQAFEASLQGLCTQYASKKAPQIVEEKLQPHIDRTRSFAAAIAASTQSDASAKFCLSSLFITIQVIPLAVLFPSPDDSGPMTRSRKIIFAHSGHLIVHLGLR